MCRGPLPAAVAVAALVAVWPLAAGGACLDARGEWTSRASLDIARQETGAARIGGTVYVVGGLLANGQATDTVEAYDVALDRWTFVAPLPVPRDHLGVAATGGRLYVVGGYAGDFAARADVFAYDPATDAWTPRAPLPAPRGACWAVAQGGKLYVVGGTDTDGAAQASIFVYDPATDGWTRGADMPTPREHLNAAVVGDAIYVLGGRSAGVSTRANERYHPATDAWQALTPVPTGRAAAAVAALGGRIFVAGGETPMLFSLHEVYDVAADGWSEAASMAIPRHGIAAVALDDRILAPGGGTVQGLAATAAVDVFVPASAAPTSACPATPAPCRAPAVGGRARLLLRTTSSGRARLRWDWRKGRATTRAEFGDPAGSDGYALCVYDANGLVADATAPPGSGCPGRAGWRSTRAGFRYRDRAPTADGIASIVLAQGRADGRARIVVEGKDVRLSPPDLATLASPVTVQLRRGDAEPCWEAGYSFPPALRADGTTFKDRAD